MFHTPAHKQVSPQAAHDRLIAVWVAKVGRADPVIQAERLALVQSLQSFTAKLNAETARRYAQAGVAA